MQASSSHVARVAYEALHACASAPQQHVHAPVLVAVLESASVVAAGGGVMELSHHHHRMLDRWHHVRERELRAWMGRWDDEAGIVARRSDER